MIGLRRSDSLKWILAVLALSFISARSQSCEDSVFSEVPQQLLTYAGLHAQAASATGVMPLTNDCDYVTRYEMKVDNPKFSLNAWGSSYWIWPHSQSYVKVTCDIPVGPFVPATVTLTAISSSGNITMDVRVFCFNNGLEFDPTWGPGSIEVSPIPGEERDYLLKVYDSGGYLPGKGNLTNELVETYPSGVFDTYNVSGVPVGTCGGVWRESLFGGRVREEMSNLKDALLDPSKLSERRKCQGPPTTTTSTTSTAPCCEELEVDIRDDPNYKIFDMAAYGHKLTRWDFIFPLYNSNGTEFVLIYPNGMVTAGDVRGELEIEIPNSSLFSFWAAYWQDYDAVAEVGGVGNSSQYTVQWTNASISGVGEFTFQMTFYADANIAIRSNICEDQGDLIVNSLSGYQEWMYHYTSKLFFSGTFDLAAGYDVLRRATLSRSPNDWPSIERSPRSIDVYPGGGTVTLTTTGVEPLPAMSASPIEIRVYMPQYRALDANEVYMPDLAALGAPEQLVGAYGMLVQLQ